MGGRNILIGGVLLALGAILGSAGVLWWQQGQGPEDVRTEAPARMLEATVYLPVNDNQGKPFPRKKWLAAIGVLVRKFGGATLGARRTGFWLGSDNHIQSEPIQLLTVSFPHQRLEEFRTAVAAVGRRLGQESMYVRFEEPRVELIVGSVRGQKKDR